MNKRICAVEKEKYIFVLQLILMSAMAVLCLDGLVSILITAGVITPSNNGQGKATFTLVDKKKIVSVK